MEVYHYKSRWPWGDAWKKSESNESTRIRWASSSVSSAISLEWPLGVVHKLCMAWTGFNNEKQCNVLAITEAQSKETEKKKYTILNLREVKNYGCKWGMVFHEAKGFMEENKIGSETRMIRVSGLHLSNYLYMKISRFPNQDPGKGFFEVFWNI